MMENKEKIYVGSGKEKFDGNLIDVSINLSKISKNAKDFIFEYGGDKYIKLKVVKKKGPDEYGKSHYVEVDTWKPESSASAEDKGMSYGEPVRKEGSNEEMNFGEYLKKEEQSDEELPF